MTLPPKQIAPIRHPSAPSDHHSTPEESIGGLASWFHPILTAMRPILDPFWGRSHLMLLTHPFDFVDRDRSGLRELVRFRGVFRENGIRLVLGPTADDSIHARLIPRAAILIDRQGVLRASVRYPHQRSRTLEEMVKLASLIDLD